MKGEHSFDHQGGHRPIKVNAMIKFELQNSTSDFLFVGHTGEGAVKKVNMCLTGVTEVLFWWKRAATESASVHIC